MVTSIDVPREMKLRDAKARFSEMVDAAAQGEAILVTRHGKPAAVVIGVAEWRRLSEKRSFVDMLLAFPAEPGDETLFERDQTPMRDPGF